MSKDKSQSKYKGTEHFYVCDPEKAKGCKKDNCYLKGGRCNLTLNPKWGKKLYIERSDDVVFRKGDL